MRRRSRKYSEQRRRSVRMAVALGMLALFVMFASMYFYWSNAT